MNILAIDTTTKKANVTLGINDSVTNKSIDNEITHSEKLLPLIDECLKQANSKLSDIDTFCITTGPGSFTGVRIGIATVKAFAKTTGSRIFAVNSLEVLSYDAILSNAKADYVLATLDAKNNRIYYALYKFDNSVLIPVIVPSNDNIQDAIHVINSYFESLNINSALSTSLVISGETHDIHAEDISNINIKTYILNTSISSRTLAIIASKYMSSNMLYNDKYIYNYANLDATYIRQSQAERLKNGEEH